MTLSLSPSPESSSSSSTDTQGPAVAAPITTTPANQPAGTDLETIDLASNHASALGLNDNLLLAGLVAVFALAVIGLVSAGGHRGTWRRH